MWNPGSREQAAGRAHRLGQKKVVEVMALICRKEPIEEKLIQCNREKSIV